MSDTCVKQQAHIDALLNAATFDPVPVQKRLLHYAEIGMEKPESLTANEIQQICYALALQYTQIGI